MPDTVLGRPSAYPWAEWFDGRTWEITQGEDYIVASASMAAIIRSRARRHGMRAAAVNYGDRIVFQVTRAEA